MSRERQKQQSEEMRRRILDISKQILAEEGAEALSIRRITREMDYSGAIVYHYFESKEEILHCLLVEGYQKILASIQPLEEEGLPAGERIRRSIVSYISGVLAWPAEYRSVMFSSKPDVLAATSVLDEDVCEKRAAFRWLVSTIETGVAEGIFAPCDARLTAQALWCSMFGLVMRLIIEAPVPEKQQAALIDRQIDLMMKGLFI